ncbi:DUF2637 domain-containing protein [Actinomadura litoris]|uniref:DUF2637 domain-containing protein n=1 Tax=Actinomadura litoris TaxID=2678616 RepID=UPI001FA7EF05|nr:DUF2637 domain-containing protein [Actinomadura litoris]
MIRRRPQHRADGPDAQTTAGIVTIAAAAAVTSFAHLVDLAKAAGWHDELAWLLPVTIDLYAAVTTRIWLRRATPPTVRAHARAHALTAISLSMVGNAVSGALFYGALRLGEHTWLLVVSTHLVAPAALAGVSHLAALLSQHRTDRATVPGAAPAQREEGVAPATEPPTVPEPAKVLLTKGVPAPKRITEPADETPATGQRAADRATVPGLARQAVAAAGARPATVDLTVPPIPATEPPRATAPADHAAERAKTATAPPATEPTAPVALRPGSRPDNVTIEKTRALYREHRTAGRALTDRQLAVAAQAGGLAIGRRACARIINEETP